MFSIGMSFCLKPDCYAEYRHAHDNLWPEIVESMAANNVSTCCMLSASAWQMVFAAWTLTRSLLLSRSPSSRLISLPRNSSEIGHLDFRARCSSAVLFATTFWSFPREFSPLRAWSGTRR